MIKLFKFVAISEGVSYLALFANMLLVKPNNPDLYKTLLYPIGMGHGVLFIAYIVLAILVALRLKWSFGKFAIVAIASLLPFGTFFVEKKYL